jgi:hypothetical protein
VLRGWQDVSQPNLGYATVGNDLSPIGNAATNGIVSLGDGGAAICTFQHPIQNGAGADFAVFENGFDDNFLELALVEVSTDGVHYARFKAHSLTDTTTQTGSFGYTDPTKINNLAGKYRGGYGTPFDLQELENDVFIDINNINFVKIIDVVGSTNPAYAMRDGFGNKINDPWATPFASSGFDLHGIGVLHENTNVATQLENAQKSANFTVFPNPAQRGNVVFLTNNNLAKNYTVKIFDALGKLLTTFSAEKSIDTANLAAGIYFICITTNTGVQTLKLVVE